MVKDEILSKVELHESIEYGVSEYNLHPSVLDACLYTIFAAKMSDEDEERGIYLPIHIDRYKFHSKPKSKTVYSYIKVAEASSDYLKGDFWIIDENGSLVAEIQGLDCKYIEGSRKHEQDLSYSGCYEYEWTEAEEFVHEPANDAILMFNEPGFLWSSFRTKIEEKGTTIIDANIADYEDREHVKSVVKEIKEAHPSLNKIVISLPLSDQNEQIKEATVNLSRKVLNIFNAIIEEEIQPSIWLINEKADIVTEEDKKINLLESVSYGLARVMVNEYPLATVKIADLGDKESEDELESLAKLVSSTSNGGDESDFAFRDDKVFVSQPWAGAVLSSNNHYLSMGLDIEKVGRITLDLWPLLYSKSELTFINAQPITLQNQWSAVIYSLKEAYYKMQFPLFKMGMEHKDLQVIFDESRKVRLIPRKTAFDKSNGYNTVIEYEIKEVFVISNILLSS